MFVYTSSLAFFRKVERTAGHTAPVVFGSPALELYGYRKYNARLQLL